MIIKYTLSLALLCCGVWNFCDGAGEPEPIIRYGRTVQVHANGHYYPVPDMALFLTILKRYGIEGDDAIIKAGNDAFQFISDTHGIDVSAVNNSLLLATLNPPEIMSSDGTWKYDIGVMGPGSNIHIIAETITTTDGKTYSRAPRTPVRMMFAYWRATCNIQSCPIAGGKTIPQGARAVMDIMVSTQEDADRGWNLMWEVEGRQLTYTYSETPGILKVILDSDVSSKLFGPGDVNGIVEIDGTNRNKDGYPAMKLAYLVTFTDLVDTSDIPEWAKSGSKNLGIELLCLTATALISSFFLSCS